MIIIFIFFQEYYKSSTGDLAGRDQFFAHYGNTNNVTLFWAEKDKAPTEIRDYPVNIQE